MADGATVGLGTARVQKQPGVCGGSSEAKALSPPKGVQMGVMLVWGSRTTGQANPGAPG